MFIKSFHYMLERFAILNNKNIFAECYLMDN